MGEMEGRGQVKGESCGSPETGDGLVDPFPIIFFRKAGGLVDPSHRTWGKFSRRLRAVIFFSSTSFSIRRRLVDPPRDMVETVKIKNMG